MQKEAEADALREAIAASNRSNAACEARGADLSRDLARERKRADELDAKAKGQEEEIGRMRGRLTETKREYEGTTTSREELIRELLEKEKGTGKRIQELALRASSAEETADGLRRDLAASRGEAEAARAEVQELRRALEKKPTEEELRHERDLLLGRVERLAEERGETAKRRWRILDGLATKLASLVPGADAARHGALLRVTFPEGPKDGGVPKEWPEAARAAAEDLREEGGCVLALCGAGAAADAVRSAVLADGRFPADGVLVLPPFADGRLTLLVLAP